MLRWARDISLHLRLATNTGERAVAGRVKGLIGADECVTFSAKHFGVRFELSARISRFEPPFRFVDEQFKGPFAQFIHTHEFEPLDSTTTLMRDRVEFLCPMRIVGRVAEPLVERHLRSFLIQRARSLKIWLENQRAPLAFT